MTPLSLPSPQKDADIGPPPLAGSATFRLGTYTVTGSGNDIWGQEDQFNFVYQPITGDVDVSARVASLQGSSTWAKAGVMIRESLAQRFTPCLRVDLHRQGHAHFSGASIR